MGAQPETKLVLATRSSPLALWQAEATHAALVGAGEIEAEVLALRSSGDIDLTTPLARFGSIGIFTAEVDAAVLDGRAHAAVHSLKDQTTTLPDGLVLAAVLPRGPVEDALVSASGAKLADLPTGARVATGSTRRAALLRSLRPDLELVALRGNVARRLACLERGEADALLMARAALVRLGLEARISEVLDPADFVPAVCQGIVGIVCRAHDERARAALAKIDHGATHSQALAERAFLRALRGGCNVPAGALATVAGERLTLIGSVLSPDGSERLERRSEGPLDGAEAIGEALAGELIGAGAERLLKLARP